MEEKSIKSPLNKKTITIIPVVRKGAWKPQGHEVSTILPGSMRRLRGVPYDNNLRRPIDPLTEDEKQWLYDNGESLNIGPGDLSVHKRPNFWTTFEVKLSDDPMSLDLSDTMDWLRWKFLLAQKDYVSPDVDHEKDKATYKYAIKDADAESVSEVKKYNVEKEVNRYFYKIEDDEQKLRALLDMYYKNKRSLKKVPKNAKITFLTSEVYRLIKDDLQGIYNVIQDKNFETKFLINRAIDNSLIERLGGSEYKIVGEEDVMSLTELIKFLDAKKNQVVRAKLENQLD